jgi:cell division septation protein DedD
VLTVDQLVGELLLRHNCVIVPSFGGFIAKKKSATIDYTTGIISPPSKSLLFNRQLINSDGLLVADLAFRNKISYEEATALVDKQVGDWNQMLNNGTRVVIDKVGFLFLDGEKNICFEQDRFFNLLLESYGLGKVVFLAEEDVAYAQQTVIQHQISEEKSAPVIVLNTESSSKIETPVEKELEPKIIAHPELKKRSAAWKYIAAACFLPIAFYSVWIPVKTDFLASGVLRLDHFNPFASESRSEASEAAIQIETVNATTTSQEIEAPQDEEVTVVNNEEPVEPTLTESIENNVAAPKPAVNTKSFDYIVGSFADPINAQKKIEELQALGMNAFIKETSDGMTRVSIGTTSNAKDVERLSQEATKHGIKGWILKK